MLVKFLNGRKRTICSKYFIKYSEEVFGESSQIISWYDFSQKIRENFLRIYQRNIWEIFLSHFSEKFNYNLEGIFLIFFQEKVYKNFHNFSEKIPGKCSEKLFQNISGVNFSNYLTNLCQKWNLTHKLNIKPSQIMST